MYSTIDTHVAGEAFRIVIHSPIVLNEDSIALNHNRLQHNYQKEMKILLNEPRGHSDMNGCIILPSTVADYAILFFHDDDRSVFTYSGFVATITALIETGNIEETDNGIYTIETTEGIYEVHVTTDQEEVTAVYIESAPCIVQEDVRRTVTFSDSKRSYRLFQLPSHIPEIHLDHLVKINAWGKETVAHVLEENKDISGIILVEPFSEDPNTVRSVTFKRDGSILRSPGFDSTCAILASLRLENKEVMELTNTSIFNSTLTGCVIEEKNDQFSIVTEGFVTGSHEFIVDQDDPFQSGFILK